MCTEIQAVHPRDGHMVPAVLRRVIVKLRNAEKSENNFTLHEQMKIMEILAVIKFKRSKVDLG